MNILLAFKAEPDLGMLAENDWQNAVMTGQEPDITRLRAAVGMDEQAGAELLLCARDDNRELHLTALSIGDHRASHGLRHFAALGFTRRILIETSDPLRFSPARIASYIAGWHKEHNQQLIVLGSQSAEGQNGQTGWLLAEMLGWPCIAGVTHFSLKEGAVQVNQETDASERCWNVHLPAILIVRNKGQIALRVPGMRQRLAAAKCLITCIPPVESEDILSVICRQFSRNETRREGVRIEGADTAEKVQRLWDGYLRQRMTR